MPTGDSTAKVVGNNLVLNNGQVQGMADGSASTHGATVGQTAAKTHATQHKSGGTDAIALNELSVPTADVSFGTHKATGLADATVTGDAVHFGQVVTTSVNGLMLATDKLTFDQSYANGARSSVKEDEDFVCGGNTASGAAAISTGTCFGKLSFRAVFSGTAAAVTLVTTNQDSTHRGIVQLSTGSTTTGACGIARLPASTPNFIFGSGQVIVHEWLVRIPTLSNGTDTYTFRCGYRNAVNVTPTDGIFFEYSSAAPSSGNWIGRTVAASVSTTASGGSTVPVSSGAWVRLTMTWDGTTATFLVNGTSIGTSTTNIPTAATCEGADIVKSAGTTAGTVLADYMWQHITWGTPRAA